METKLFACLPTYCDTVLQIKVISNKFLVKLWRVLLCARDSLLTAQGQRRPLK